VGHKVNPVGFRVGIFKDWQSRWYASKKDYANFLKEDFSIRKELSKKSFAVNTESVVIDRTGDLVKVVLNSANTGSIIGKKGAGIDGMKDLFKKKYRKKIDLIVKDVKSPEMSAQLVANNIAEQMEKRVNFKKLMKSAGFAAIKGGAKGIKICCSGKLGGTEIARSEWFRFGAVPLHTIRSNIDYATAIAKTVYGVIGVKVWVCKGEF